MKKGKKAFAPEVRATILAYAKEHSVKEAAAKYKVDASSIYAWRYALPKTDDAGVEVRVHEVEKQPRRVMVKKQHGASMVVVCDTGSLSEVLRSMRQ